jgi:predicted nucleotidyltransferase
MKTDQTSSLQLPVSLGELREMLRSHGVVRASVFGSYARGTAVRGSSDLDLLVQLGPGKTYLDLGGLQFDLEHKLGIKADLATKLNKHFEPYITPELVEIL